MTSPALPAHAIWAGLASESSPRHSCQTSWRRSPSVPSTPCPTPVVPAHCRQSALSMGPSMAAAAAANGQRLIQRTSARAGSLPAGAPDASPAPDRSSNSAAVDRPLLLFSDALSTFLLDPSRQKFPVQALHNPRTSLNSQAAAVPAAAVQSPGRWPAEERGCCGRRRRYNSSERPPDSPPCCASASHIL